MKKILINAVALTLASTVLMAPSYASFETDESRFSNVDGDVYFSPTRWRLVKQTFVLHFPENSNAVTQIIIATPPTVAVSNDIEVLEHKGRKISINVSVNGKNIILGFLEPVAPGSRIEINFNKVKQPILDSTSVYRFSAKVVGSDTEIPIGVAEFRTD
ncbi:DUF2808 domain-containing protein [Microcoleus sp. BROC3]|uniref:DUF2808 domain-containing protein n=1 Tax=Microcoleus sp. BROC3 TaxID=3055323 RepID=UPI002FD1D5FE